MIVLVLAFLASQIPLAFMFFWMRDKVRQPQDEAFKNTCNDAFVKGLLSTLAVLPISGVFALLGRFMNLSRDTSVLGAAYHTFIVLAFAEELIKVGMCYMVMKKSECKYTWQDIIIFMVTVALGFELLESIIYAVGSGPIHMIVRGVTLMHGGYGFIEGWFMGKAAYTKKKWYVVIGFVICWLMHGAYDFGLSPILSATYGDNTAILSVSLALIALVTFAVMIIFFARKKKPQYLEPLR